MNIPLGSHAGIEHIFKPDRHILTLRHKCISEYMCDCWITGSSGSLDEVTIKRMMHF